MLQFVTKRYVLLVVVFLIFPVLVGPASTAVAQGGECLDSGNVICVQESHNVGIGMQTPNVQLEVQGMIHTNDGLSFASRNDIGEYIKDAPQGQRWTWTVRSGVARLGPAGNGNRMVVEPGGNIGIGTNSPQALLDVAGGPKWATDSNSYQWGKSIRLQNVHAMEFLAGGGNSRFGIGARNNPVGLYFMQTSGSGADAKATYPMMIRSNGNVGMGVTDPKAKLDIAGGPKWATDDSSRQWGKSIRLQNTHAIEFLAGGGNSRFGIGARNNRVGLYFMQTSGSGADAKATYPMMIRSNGNVGIGTINPGSTLHVEGTTTTSVLQITGGSDLAEPFAVNDSSADDSSEIEPGTVVILDADNPGELRVAQRAYDPLVAGVISGAGDIQPGLIMQQEERANINGEMHPVALTGQVYVKAVGPVQVGDLLTTSDAPGHAMAATDRDKAFGATLGKAMSDLADEESGLVLVLVALQ